MVGAGVELLKLRGEKVIGWIKKHWHDPVWSNVFGAAMFAALAAIGTYFLDWWPIISRAFLWAYDFLVSATAVQNWLLGVLLIPPLLILILILLRYLDWRKHRTSKQILSWRNYTSDTFFGIKWSWKLDETGQVSGLYSLCPHCDYQIYPKQNYSWGSDKVDFHCENCNSNLGSHTDTEAQLENKVIRHIQRKLRTGEWLTSSS